MNSIHFRIEDGFKELLEFDGKRRGMTLTDIVRDALYSRYYDAFEAYRQGGLDAARETLRGRDE